MRITVNRDRLNYGLKKAHKRLLILLLFVFALYAGQKSAAEEIDSVQDDPVGLEHLNDLNKAERDIRDPFWPVGYYPEWWLQRNKPKEEDPQEIKQDKWAEARKKIAVSGMSKMGNSGYFAVINGRTVGQGDTISVEYEGMTYRWVLTEIGQQGIRLNRIEE